MIPEGVTMIEFNDSNDDHWAVVIIDEKETPMLVFQREGGFVMKIKAQKPSIDAYSYEEIISIFNNTINNLKNAKKS